MIIVRVLFAAFILITAGCKDSQNIVYIDKETGKQINKPIENIVLPIVCLNGYQYYRAKNAYGSSYVPVLVQEKLSSDLVNPNLRMVEC